MATAQEKQAALIAQKDADKAAALAENKQKEADLLAKYPPNGVYQARVTGFNTGTQSDFIVGDIVDLSHLQPKQIAFLIEVRHGFTRIVDDEPKAKTTNKTSKVASLEATAVKGETN